MYKQLLRPFKFLAAFFVLLFAFQLTVMPQSPGGVASTSLTNGVAFDFYDGRISDLENNNPSASLTLLSTGYVNNPNNVGFVANENGDTYTLVYKAKIKVDVAANTTYRFKLDNVDDYAALFIDGDYVCGCTSSGSPAENYTFTAATEYCNMELRFSENIGGQSMTLRWDKTGGTSYVTIPDDLFFVENVPMSSWHKADDGATGTNGNTITGWTDKSTNGNDLTGIVRNPVYYSSTAAQLMNFNPSVEFEGGDELDVNDHAFGFGWGKQSRTIFAVSTKNEGSGVGIMTGYGRDNGNNQINVGQSSNDLFIGFYSNDNTGSLDICADEKNYINTAQYINTNISSAYSTNNVLGYVNGSSALSVAKTAPFTTLNDYEDFAIGRSPDVSAYFVGNIAEVITYPWALGEDERNRVETYLAVKYGITLEHDYISSTGATVWDRTANTGYNNDIFGLAYDSGSALYQKISQSTSHSISPLTISLTSDLSGANSSNAGTLTDGDYLLLGCNQSILRANVNSVTNVPSGYDLRTSAVWKAQVTGTASQDVFMFFDDKQEYSSDASNLELYVLVDDNTSFSSPTATLVVDGYTVAADGTTKTAVTINDGDYVTVVAKYKTQPILPGGVKGAMLWLRADSVYITTTWTDITTGVAYSVTGSPTTADSAHNFNPGITFDGSQYIDLGTGYADFTQGLRSFVVAEPTANTNYGMFFEFGNGDPNDNFYLSRRATYADDIAASSRLGTSNTSNLFKDAVITNNKTKLYGLGIPAGDAGTSQTSYIYGNNQSYSGNLAIPNVVERKYNSLGALATSTFHANNFVGDIPEFILFNRELTDVENMKINSYLAVKYGLTMATSATNQYVNSEGLAVLDYKADYSSIIFGIGRDSISGLHQRIAQSVNDDVFTVSTDSNYVNANDHHTAINADKDFLMFAANSGSYSTTTSEKTSGYNQRITREWYVQASGNFNQNVTLHFEGYGAGASTVAYLMVDDNGDFSDATLIHQLGDDGEITLSSDVIAGKYITLFLNDVAPGGVSGQLYWWIRFDKDFTVQGDGDVGTIQDQTSRNFDVTGTWPWNKHVRMDSTAFNFNPAGYFNGSACLNVRIGTFDAFNGSYDKQFTAYFAQNLNRDNTDYKNIILGGQYTLIPADYYDMQLQMLNGKRFNAHSCNNLGLCQYSSGYNSRFNDGHIDILSFERRSKYNSNISLNYQDYPVSSQAYSIQYAPYNNGSMYLGGMNRLGGPEYMFNGYIGEAIVYKDDMSDNEHQRISSYMAIKTGTMLYQKNGGSTPVDFLSSRSTVIWDASEVGDYNNDAFGIARDDESGLDQRISRSADEFHLIVSLNTDFTHSNVDHTAHPISFDRNQSFLIFSNNGLGAVCSKTDEIPDLGYNCRILMEWRVNKTNFNQKVSFCFPNYKSVHHARYALLVSDDSDFSDAQLVGELDSEGVITIVDLFNQSNNGVDGTEGAIDSVVYITVASAQLAPGGVAGEMIWVRGDMWTSSTTDGDALTYWGDVNKWMDYGAVNGPVFSDVSHNYNPAVTFDGNNDYVTLGSDPFEDYQDFTTGLTSFFMSNRNSSADSYARFFDLGDGAGDDNIGFGRWNNTNYIYGDNYRGSSNNPMYSSTDVLTNGKDVLSSYHFGDITKASGDYVPAHLYKNGARLSANKASVLVPRIDFRDNNYLARSSWGNFFGGDIPEGIVYNWELSPQQRRMVNTYLSVRHGIPMNDSLYVNSDTAIVWNTAYAASNYNKGVFGLAHDSITALDQRIATVANDTTLTIALDDNFVASNLNLTARPTTLKNLEYFLVGHNGKDSLFSESNDVPKDDRFNTRLSRVYFVQTNIPAKEQNVYLKFKGDVFNANYTYYLLTSPTGKFKTDGVVEGTLDANYEYNITLKDSMFFTVAAKTVSPGGIGGYSIWYRADKKTTLDANNYLSDWGDMAMAPNDAYNNENANSVQWTNNAINFNPALNTGLGGWDQDLRSTDNVTAQEFFVVAEHYSVLGFGGLIGYTSDLGVRAQQSPNDTYRDDGNNANSGDWTYSGGTMRINGSDGNNYGGTEVFHMLTAENTSVNSGAPLYLGGYYSARGDRCFKGEMPEAIAYPSTISEASRQRVETYLAVKYGFFYDYDYVATDSTVIWDKTTLATYHHDVFGLGLDSTELLDQRISTSYNSSSILTVSLDNDFSSANTDLTARPTAFTNDVSYLMFGNDGALTTVDANSTELPSGSDFNGRITREWLVRATNITSQDVYMKFDGFNSSGSMLFYAVVDTDKDGGDFTDATQWVQLDNTGRTQAALTVSDSSYITIATVLSAPGGVYSALVNGVHFDWYSGYSENEVQNGSISDTYTLKSSGYVDAFDFSSASTIPFFNNYGNTNLSIRFKAKLKISTAGTYYLAIYGGNNQTDDEACIKIDTNGDGVLDEVVNYDLSDNSTVDYYHSSAITLSKGYHDMEVLYSQGTGDNKLFVRWSQTETSGYVPIPDSLLFVNATLASWHKADDGIEASEGVAMNDTVWYDQSANSNDLTAVTSPFYYQSTLTEMLNYNPGIRMDGNDAMRLTKATKGFAWHQQGRTTFSASTNSPNVSNYRGTIACYGNQGENRNKYSFLANSSSKLVLDVNGYTTEGTLAGFTSPGSVLADLKYFNPDITDLYQTNYVLGYMAGNEALSSTLGLRTVMSNYTADQYDIGHCIEGNSSNPFYGTISEVIQYPWALDTFETQRVQSYMAIKYGSTLPYSYLASDSTVTWDTTGVVAYCNNIFGIGLDVASALDQRISKSQTAANTVAAIALENDFTHANTDTANRKVEFNNDIQFMVLGSTTGTTTVDATTDMPTAFRLSARMEREWLVQATDNFDQDVYMQFEGCESTGSIVYYLLIDTVDGVFADATQFIELDANGVTTTSVTLQYGDYLTVGMRVIAPGGIVGQELWLRADYNINSTANSVTGWTNFGDNTHDYNNTSGSNLPTYDDDEMNFNPALYFDSGSDYLNHTSGSVSNLSGVNLTLFLTADRASGTSKADLIYYVCDLNNSDGFTTGNNWNNIEMHLGYGDEGGAANTVHFFIQDQLGGRVDDEAKLYSTCDETVPCIISGTKSYSTASLYLNNNLKTTDNANTFNGRTAVYSRIGGPFSGARYFNGNVTEIISYRSVLDESQRLRVNSYLAIKYGMTIDGYNYLATDSTTVWDKDAGGGSFNNDIFGIGRDDFEALDQRISKSVNDTSVLTVSLDKNFTVSNLDTATRSTEFTQDVDYIVFGSNDGSIVFDNTNVPVRCDMRMSREWLVQSTDTTDQAVYMQFDSCHSSTDTIYYVLESTVAGDFSNADILVALDTVGVTRSAVVLTDSTYITVAYKIPTEALGGVLWLKANEGTTDNMAAGDVVTYWEDRSGQGNDVTQATTANAPVISDSLLNFNPTVQFNAASSKWMDIPDGIVDTASWRSFSVIRGGAARSSWMALGNGTLTDPYLMHQIGTNALSLQLDGGDGYSSSVYENYVNDGLPAVLFTSSDVKDTTALGYNGMAQVVDTINAKGSPYYFTLGASYNGTALQNYYDGEIAEIIWYCATDWPSDGEKEHIIESYLALKYGFTLDSGRMDYLSGDTVAVWSQSKAQVYLDNYNHNIFGIARDTLMGLHQKVSKSLNPEAIVTATIALDRTNNDVADFEASNMSTTRIDSIPYMAYNVFADNGDSAAWIGDNAPDSFFVMQRTWQVQESAKGGTTRDVGEIYLQFDVNDPDFDVPELMSGTSYYVVIDEDADSLLSDETPIALEETAAGSGLWRIPDGEGVNVADKAIFTLATKTRKGPGGVTGGLMLWARADKGVAINQEDFVDTWTDFSNGLVYPASDSVEYKDTTYNFNPGIRFMHDSVFVQLPDGYENFTQGMESFTLVNQDISDFGLNVFYSLIFDRSLASGFYAMGAYMSNEHSTYFGYIDYYEGQSVTLPQLGNASASLLGTRSNAGLTTTDLTLYCNAKAYPVNSKPILSYKTRTQNYIGYTGTYEHYGSLPEVIMYNRELDSISRLKVNSYLALKYGITLDSGKVNYLASDSTLMWSTTTAAGTYTNNIFGIGRDDTDSLYQRISKSVDTTAIVTLALEEDFTSPNDASRTETIANLNFQTISNNGGTNTWGGAAPFGYSALNRVWQAQETGTVDSVYLQFDLDDAEFDVPAAMSGDYYYLLVDENHNGSLADETPILMTQDATNASCFNVAYDFTSGQLFTLASAVIAPGGVSDDLALWVRADRGLEQWMNDKWIDSYNGDTCIVHGAQLLLSADSNDYRAVHNYNYGITFADNDTVEVYNGFADFTEGFTSFTVATSEQDNVNADFFTLQNTGSANVISSGQSSADFVGMSGATVTETGVISTTVDKIYGFNIENGTSGETSKAGNLNVNGLYTAQTGLTVPTTVERTDNTISSPNYKGEIPEVIIYQRDLSAIDRRRVDTYLAIKYGLTLSKDNDGNGGTGVLDGSINEGDYLASDTTVIWDADSLSAYHNHIFGIGQDAISKLNQAISRSVEDTTLLMMVDPDFESSNLVNRTGLLDTTFVVVGDNNDTKAFRSGLYGKPDRKMDRIWVADVTGTPDSIYLAIPLSIRFPRGIPVIIVSDDATVDRKDVMFELTEDEDAGYYWVRIPVATDKDFYFTFGALDKFKYMRHGKYFDEKGKRRRMTF